MGSSATPTRAVAAVALEGVRSGLTFPLIHRTVSCDKAPRCRLADRRYLSFGARSRSAEFVTDAPGQ